MTEIEYMRTQGWTIREIADVYGANQKEVASSLRQALHEERHG